MADFDFYTTAKILHIISFISWFAGLLYLPRLFVYHTRAQKDKNTNEIFKEMERKLLKYIMNPAMISTIIFGAILINYVGFKNGWLHAKILLVLGLVAFQHFLGICRLKFAQNNNQKSEKFYRIINEVPTILLILIVILVVSKPF